MKTASDHGSQAGDEVEAGAGEWCASFWAAGCVCCCGIAAVAVAAVAIAVAASKAAMQIELRFTGAPSVGIYVIRRDLDLGGCSKTVVI